MRECSEEVRLGIMTLWSMLSLVGGRSSRVRGLRVKDGAIVALRYVGTESIAREVPQGPRLGSAMIVNERTSEDIGKRQRACDGKGVEGDDSELTTSHRVTLLRNCSEELLQQGELDEATGFFWGPAAPSKLGLELGGEPPER